MTADEIANSRPADRVTYGEWEPYFSDNPERRMVADRVVGTFFQTVTAWREVIDERPFRGMRRKRIEWWDEPGAKIARYEWEYPLAGS